MGDWNEEARNHKIRRTAPLVDEHERPSAGPAVPPGLRGNWRRKSKRPWKVEYRTHPDEYVRQRSLGWWWRRGRGWRNWGSYKTENARDQALGNLQRKNQAYWQYRAKDP